MENQYNLLKREEEREMLPMCGDMGVGCVPYSPLGKGRLARPWGPPPNAPTSTRSRRASTSTSTSPWSRRCSEVADQRGVPMAQVAMAWVLSKPVVAAPIVGATKPHHLADAAAALEIQLSDEEIHDLEQPYTTQPPYWW